MNLDSALDSIVRDFSAGTYSSRLRIDDPDPEARRVADKVNRLLETVNNIIDTQNLEVIAGKSRSDYYVKIMAIISEDLTRLSTGDTGLTTRIPESDHYSRDAFQQGVVIGKSVMKIRDSLKSLSHDISLVSEGLGAGKLDIHIDETGYTGEFYTIVSGLNKALKDIEEPIRESMRVAHQFALYDFDARFNPSVRISGDWADLKKSFETIGGQISDAFGSINSQVMELSANAEQANASVQEVANSSEQVARNSDAVSQNTEQSDAGVRQVLRAMEDLSVTVGEVSQKAESVSRIAHESTTLSREGSEFARKAEEGMGVITRSAGDMDRLIGEIQQEMKKINEIVRLITDIANQTNLLALNAAIEAARAGDLGRGFAVVASEVKSLALESRGSAEKIIDMISNLQMKSQKAADAVTVATTAVEDGNVMLSDTLKIFGRLVTSVEDISENIEQVASMNEEQAAAVEEITSSMHEVSAMLKDTAKEAIDSAHATSETSASVHQLRVIVDQVAGISEQISVSMSRFRL